ncbi:MULTISPECIES: flagellar protein FlgN [unclassified Caballeronia]|uniref:flagella synthesis protein FlgN n=1 Tax=unclassified Caballeronia TaxID=2646786 RepID=UPI002854BB2E|nr:MULTISPECIES: flagellar protein FlgN [unclassified Caballeronia]MDR5814847.1 flagellar protein FlgN [Caballeronia sp. LZ033]MDR5821328.1 flagellar protein FlgN [Caballeronia sp. LZ043]
MRDALLATITEEVAAVQAFESLLADEEKALIAAQPLPALPGIIENKTALTERISSLEKTRDEHLNALGFPAGFIGMEAAAAGDAAIAEQWALLTAAARRAKQGNNNNGVLIRTRMEYNRKALAAMQVAPSRAGFYGPDGRVPGA